MYNVLKKSDSVMYPWLLEMSFIKEEEAKQACAKLQAKNPTEEYKVEYDANPWWFDSSNFRD